MTDVERLNTVENKSANQVPSRKREYIEIEVARVCDNPFQPRVLYEVERVESLAESIVSQGLLNPISVRPHSTIRGDYECASGHMRIRAFRLLGRSHIPAFVENLSDVEMAEHAVTENMQRENLNPVEEARGYKILVDSGHTHENVARLAGRSRAVVTNSLRLLAMDSFLQECVLCKTLDPSKALLISTLPTEYEQYRLADIAIDWSLTFQELRTIVKDIKAGMKTICWVREVPVEALYEYPLEIEAPTVTDNMEPHEPIVVLMPGLVLDNKISLGQLQRLNCTRVLAEIHYIVAWLKVREEATASVNIDVRLSGVNLLPQRSEEQRKRSRLLVERLKTHDRLYPVGVLARS